MKNEVTGKEERCVTCRFYAPTVGVKGKCTKHWRLNQKHDTDTEYDLWCQYYEEEVEAVKDEQNRVYVDEAVDPLNDLEDEGVTLSVEVQAVTKELMGMHDNLEKFDKDCAQSLTMAARHGDKIAQAEFGAMLRVTTMLLEQIDARMMELKFA